MDAVNAFNQELFSLMDSKPPISRAKMISITKSAIKAMKLYKHVVQIVEKFVKKCKSEYKIAGLYVVDSIVRQSRHQFGPDKDVFGPRFTKNITGTFENLCLCPIEDRSKIVRVLNLWQKNGVFRIEVIQPLLDMAAASGSAAATYADTEEPGGLCYSPSPAKEPVTEETENSTTASASQLQNSDAFAAVAQLFQSTQGQQLQQMLQNFQQQPVKPDTDTQPPLHNIHPPHSQNLSSGLAMVATQPPMPTQTAQQKAAFDKKLLDRFDYDDEPEVGEESKKDDMSSRPSFMQQPPAFLQHMDHLNPPMMNMSQDLSQQVPMPPNGQLHAYGLPPGQSFPVMMPPMGHALPGQPLPGSTGPPGFTGQYHNAAQQDLSMDIEHSSMKDGRHGQRSHSGSKSPKRRRSRSNSRTRRSRHRRSRSRSRERRHHSPHARSQEERRDREKERERRQKGLPPPKSETLSICSTTLWVGQLDKRTQQQDVACLLEEFGQIESINMIPPRGCAYIVMIHRQDAFRALQKLSRGTHKVNQKAIKIAWALNKGIKADFKQFWDVELGVTYIPWSQIREFQLEELKEGGVLDVDTLSPEWSGARKAVDLPEELTHNGRSEPQQPEETHVLPVPSVAAPPAQVPPMQQPMLGVGSLQPPGFPGPMGMPPPSFPPGVPPPHFIRPGFNPMQMPPGFPPPGSMPLGPPPHSKGGVEEQPLDPGGLGHRNNDEMLDGPNMFNNQMGPMGNQPSGNQLGVPPGNLQPPSGGLLGARPGLMPLQRPPGPPPPHMQRFPPPHGPRPPHPNMPIHPQMMPRGPHPPMIHHEPLPPKGGFGMLSPHNMRGPFPPHGHGPPPPQGPLPPPPHPFIRPGGGPRSLEGPEEMECRPPFRGGDRPGVFRGDREPERGDNREWDRDRDRGFGGGRRPFGDGGRGGGGGGDRMDGRDRLGGWQEDGGGDHRGGGWDRDRERDRERRDWRERRSSLEDRERGRSDDGERERGRGEGGERGRGRGEGEGGSRERGKGAEGKEGGRPRRSERRERTTRWDRDDRLAELEKNMDKIQTSNNNTEQPALTPTVAVETDKEPSAEVPQKKAESELLVSPPEVTTAAATEEPAPSEPSEPSAPPSQSTDTKEEAAS